MISQETQISELLGVHGWTIVEKREIRYLWVSEIWQVRSKWSPTDCIVYLSFEVDAQDNAQDFENVGWMRASVQRPLDWFKEGASGDRLESVSVNASCPIGRHHEKYRDEFFRDIAKIRDEWMVRI